MALGPCTAWPRSRVQSIFGARYIVQIDDLLMDRRLSLEEAEWLFRHAASAYGSYRWPHWYACWCGFQVWPLLRDERSRNAVSVALRYTRRHANRSDLIDAMLAAFDACARINDIEERWAAETAAYVAAYVVASPSADSAGSYYLHAAMDGVALCSGQMTASRRRLRQMMARVSRRI